MLKKIAAIAAFIVGLSWLIRKPKPPRPPEDHDNKGELDEEQAAVIASTWTILHPPS